MRVCIVGGGIAGTLLAWRLAKRPEVDVHLVLGERYGQDATGASGGLVRAFEPDEASCLAAADALAELRGSATLARWSGYREVGSLYVADRPPAARLLAEIDARLPGSAVLLDAVELRRRFGMAGLPGTAVGVLERHAGYFSPDRLRLNAQCDLLAGGVPLTVGRLRRLRVDGGGPTGGTTGGPTGGTTGGPTGGTTGGTTGAVTCEIGRKQLRFDVVVLAAGTWTERLLVRNGLPAHGLRTKLIQYGLYQVDGPRPPAFVDDTSGLYGRPGDGDTMLLGLPSKRWNVDPERPSPQRAAAAAVQDAAARLLPAMRLVRRIRATAAADAYLPQGRLALRPVPGPQANGRLYTFTGGSGGAAKAALATSAVAAAELLAGARAGARPHRPDLPGAPNVAFGAPSATNVTFVASATLNGA